MGRDAELARIRALVAAARNDRAGVVLVTGEAGIGKSALVADALAGSGAAWLVGFEAERDLPYAALTQLVTPLLDHLGALSAPQRAALEVVLGLRAGSEPGRLMLSVATLTLVAAAAEQQPRVIVVDDMQWVDAPSRDALLFVVRRLDAERVAMVITLREGTLDLDVVGGIPRVEITGLATGDAATMLPGSPPGWWTRWSTRPGATHWP